MPPAGLGKKRLSHLESLRLQALDLVVRGDDAEAMSLLEGADVARRDRSELLAMQSFVREAVGDMAGAESLLRRALRLAPNSTYLGLRMLQLLVDRGKWEAAKRRLLALRGLRSYRSQCRRDDELPDEVALAEARIHFAARRPNAAIAVLAQRLADSPESLVVADRLVSILVKGPLKRIVRKYGLA